MYHPSPAPRTVLLPALLAALLLCATLPAVDADSAPARTADGAELIVGFHGPVSGPLIASAGGVLKSTNSALGIAVVGAEDPALTASALRASALVSFVEANGPVFAEASGWDASGWDASGWDASGWDASGWDASGWDASGWDASGWDASGWDASGWDASGWDSAQLTAWGRTYTAGKDPLFPREWGIRASSLVQANALANAASQSICIVDSGVDHTHPELASRMWTDSKGRKGHDFVNGDSDPMDDAGHGTHVAGIAAAASKNGYGIMGGSTAKIMAVKVLDRSGVGTEANLALGIEWCVKNGARVISMSLGTPEHSPAVERAVKHAANKGVLLVASVGNAGKCYDCVRFPAAYPEVLAVGALQPDGTPAPFTSVTWAVDLAAPGVAIVSTTPGNTYRSANGTSQAAPHVSAAASLMFAAKPTLTASDAMAHLKASAIDLGPVGNDPYVGAGALNADAAVRRAMG